MEELGGGFWDLFADVIPSPWAGGQGMGVQGVHCPHCSLLTLIPCPRVGQVSKPLPGGSVPCASPGEPFPWSSALWEEAAPAWAPQGVTDPARILFQPPKP